MTNPPLIAMTKDMVRLMFWYKHAIPNQLNTKKNATQFLNLKKRKQVPKSKSRLFLFPKKVPISTKKKTAVEKTAMIQNICSSEVNMLNHSNIGAYFCVFDTA